VDETGGQNDLVERQVRRVQVGLVFAGAAAAGAAQFLDPAGSGQIPWDKLLGFGGVFMVLVGSLWSLDKRSVGASPS